MKPLRPFFTYFGGKYRLAGKMPSPEHGQIVEAFAGSAGYALRHPDVDVLLVEKSPRMAAVWRYLITATPDDIRALPDLPEGATTDDLDTCQGARDLIGLRLNGGAAAPRKRASAWMRKGTHPRQYWGPFVRDMIADQVPRIKHWRVLEGSYEQASDMCATWIIDPPYSAAGRHYPYGAAQIDFTNLAQWCKARKGLVFVHEAAGAAWLPFLPYAVAKATSHGSRAGAATIGARTSQEVLYCQRNGEPIHFDGP